VRRFIIAVTHRGRRGARLPRRDGRQYGSFPEGFRDEIHYLGCCWALMCVQFVVGVMSLLQVAALTVFVFIEKIGPRGWGARIAGRRW
jgi:predicted metal-binding membrane protein